ncbi:MAG: hypothetical protein IJY90_02250 [Clostridia bacterium]|nr:hypothetical protein [Clostridia bacterium]
MSEKKADFQSNDNYHYVIAGFTRFKDVFKKIKKAMPYYRFGKLPKKKITETFYDNEYNMLSDAGIILSKSATKKDAFFNIRRLSRTLHKKSKKYKIDSGCQSYDHPRDYAQKIATAIDNMFSASLPIDVENIVKKTKPMIEIILDKTPYEMVCGTGFKGKITHENVTYKDVATGKKVIQESVCLSVPVGDAEETQEILRVIERVTPSLVLFKESRFELAQKLLYPEPVEEVKQEFDEE